MAWIDALFKRMVELGASDLHMTSGMNPRFRLHGDVVPVEGVPVISPEQMKQILMEISPAENKAQFNEECDTDFAYALEGYGRFRVNLFVDHRGPGAVFRAIPSEILTAEQLDLPPAVLDMCNLSKGLVVVTGPTGSGKSTTLAAMIDHINKTRNDHILTIEDPIEFVHPEHQCLINQREVGRHTESFKRALRAALREDPDIVLVGEMRDLETIEIAVETAETGHLVFGTLHTTTAASTVDRLIDQFPSGQQSQIRTMLSTSLKGVVAQTLCKKKPKGRVAALEVLVVNNAISAQIREGKTYQIASSMQMGGKLGMRLLNDSLGDLVKSGDVDPMEAYRKAVNKEELVTKLSGMGIHIDPAKAEAPGAPIPSTAPTPSAPSAPAAHQPQPAAEEQGGGGAPLSMSQDAPAPLPSQAAQPAPEEPAPAPQPGNSQGGEGYTDPFEAFKKKRSN